MVFSCMVHVSCSVAVGADSRDKMLVLMYRADVIADCCFGAGPAESFSRVWEVAVFVLGGLV